MNIISTTKWPIYSLNELCQIIIGRTPSRSKPSYWGKGHNWLSISDMGNFKYITQTKETITDEGADICGKRLIQPGTVVFSFKLSIGKVGILSFPMYTNEAIAALKIKNNSILCSDYLYYALSAIDFKGKTDRAVMGQTLNKSKLEKIQIPLPPIAEQKRIATILDKADTIRKKRQEAIKLTEELLRSQFLEMFGDPVTNPKGWEIVEISELLSIVSGQVDPQTHPYIDMPHIGGENIESNTGYISGVKTPRELALKSGKYLFKPTDVLYSKIRPYLNKVVIPDFTGICSADIYPLSVNESKLNRHYLVYLLRSNLFLKYAEKHSTRTNIPKINRPTLLKFMFPYPPLKLQKDFSKIYNKVNSIKKKIDCSVENSDNLFNSLLQKAFKGEL